MTDLWQRLSEDPNPKILYGMGDGADKILAVCDTKGIEIAGVFASDGFARGNLFHGMPVGDYRTTCQIYEEFTVLLCFATRREEVLANIKRIAAERPLYVPDVPIAGSELFDGCFFEKNKENFEAARRCFADERSKKVFDLILQSKLHGDLEALFSETSSAEEDFSELLHGENYRFCGDFGAYTGDTVKEFLRFCPGIQEITAVEPDPKTFRKLQKNTEELPVLPVEGAVWDNEELLPFKAAGGRGAGIRGQGPGASVGVAEKKQRFVRGFRGDTLFEDKKVDFLKFDVEGAEQKALWGLHNTIERDQPEMLVSCYHRPEDLYALPLYLKERYPFYDLYLRRRSGVPAWDINLYAIPKTV